MGNRILFFIYSLALSLALPTYKRIFLKKKKKKLVDGMVGGGLGFWNRITYVFCLVYILEIGILKIVH